jgi:HD-GYP domain-containing protein (c-di-GMP phosphodiesterase class II)
MVDKVQNLSLSQVISALSYALDLTEGQPAGHSVRCCWIGMHIGKIIGLESKHIWNLYYTLLLKDAGCSSNAARLYELYGSDERQAKKDFKLVDNDSYKQMLDFVLKHTAVGSGLISKTKRLINIARFGDEQSTEMFATRCERGADIAKRLGFNDEIADGIRYLDEHWNGNGKPYGVAGDQIPINAQIALLSQVTDVFFQIGGQVSALNEVRSRKGSWFNPALVDALLSLETQAPFWETLTKTDLESDIRSLEPEAEKITLTQQKIDDITYAFAMIVDAKSPFTHDHSSRVADYTVKLSQHFGFSFEQQREINRCALLHDIGKLGVSNHILDKPGKLTDDEFKQVQRHPLYSEQILQRIQPFNRIAKICGAHHEKLNGKGYPYGLKSEEILFETKLITVADIFDALTASRPYRDAMPIDKALSILKSECGSSIEPDIYEALIQILPQLTIGAESQSG